MTPPTPPSETPETDAFGSQTVENCFANEEGEQLIREWADFARSLERRLREVEARIKYHETKAEKAVVRAAMRWYQSDCLVGTDWAHTSVPGLIVNGLRNRCARLAKMEGKK